MMINTLSTFKFVHEPSFEAYQPQDWTMCTRISNGASKPGRVLKG
jgi:hypothetical protein